MFFHIIFTLKLFGEIVMLASASVSGLYYRIMSDAAHNRTVDGTRTGIEQRVKLECEREQQEQLLLSVIPAYIAAEVSYTLTYSLWSHLKLKCLLYILPTHSLLIFPT